MRGPLLALALAVATSSAVEAQQQREPQRFRTGLWAEFGFGTGIVRVSCATCEKVHSEQGASSNFRIGGSLSHNVLLAFDNFSMIDETFGMGEEEIIAETTTAGMSVFWFPGRSGFFLKGGVGIAQGEFTVNASEVEATDAEPIVVTGSGFGLTFGLGYDIPLSRKISLSFNVGALVTAIGDIVLPSGRIDDVIPSSYQLTVGIVFR